MATSGLVTPYMIRVQEENIQAMHSALLAGPIVNLTIFFSLAAAIFFLLGIGLRSFSEGGPPFFGRKAAGPYPMSRQLVRMPPPWVGVGAG